MNAIAWLKWRYAGGTGVCDMDETSDWSAIFFDFDSFFVGVLPDLSLSLPVEGDLSFPFDLEADLEDFSDLFSSSFFGLSLLFLLF